MNKTSKYNLTLALFGGFGLTLAGVRFVSVISIERESGNGNTYNVTGYTQSGERATVYVETID